MDRRKCGWRIVKAAFVLCTFVALVEFGASLIRGYGFLGAIGRMSIPYNGSAADLREVVQYCQERFTAIPPTTQAKWPQASEIEENVPTLHLCVDQPYKERGIWFFESIKRKANYLYSPLLAEEHEVFWDDPNYIGIVTMCTVAKWEGPIGIYHPYRRYPKFVMKHIENEFGGEKWTCLLSDPSLIHIKSNLPPVPGAILFVGEGGKRSLTTVSCRYEKKILPVLRAIYPNLEVPDDAILE
jgi:hypothetical protein